LNIVTNYNINKLIGSNIGRELQENSEEQRKDALEEEKLALKERVLGLEERKRVAEVCEVNVGIITVSGPEQRLIGEEVEIGTRVKVKKFKERKESASGQTKEDEKMILSYIKSLNAKTVKAFMISGDKVENNGHEQKTCGEENRIERIMRSISIKRLSDEDKGLVKELITGYEEIFHLEGDILPATSLMEFNLPLIHDKPVFIRQYKLPRSHEDSIMEQVLEWKRQGRVVESLSAYNFPIILVEKEDPIDSRREPKKRVCFDARELNKISVPGGSC
jgi:hypothetical protein